MQEAIHPSRGVSGSRRSLVPYLAVVLALQACFYAGLRLAPHVPSLSWRRRPDDPAARIVRWRKASFDPAKDPALGMMVPALDLRSPDGMPVPLVPDTRHRTALVFVSDAAG